MGESIGPNRVLKNLVLLCLIGLSCSTRINPISSVFVEPKSKDGHSHVSGVSGSDELRVAATTVNSGWTPSFLPALERTGRPVLPGRPSGGHDEALIMASRDNKMNDLFDESNQLSPVDKQTLSPEPANKLDPTITTRKLLDFNPDSMSIKHPEDTLTLNSISLITNNLADSSSTGYKETEISKENQLMHASPVGPEGRLSQSTPSLGVNVHNSRYYSNVNHKPNRVFNNNHYHPSHLSKSKNLNGIGSKLLQFNHNYNSNYLQSSYYNGPKLSQTNSNNAYHLFNSNHNALSSLSQIPTSYVPLEGHQSSSNTPHNHNHNHHHHHNNQHVAQHQYQMFANNHQLSSPYVSASSVLSAAMSSIHYPISGKQEPSTPSIVDNSIDSDCCNPSSLSSSSSTDNSASKIEDLPGSDICGRQQVTTGAFREPRIVGGNSTFDGEFPWAVSIQRHGNHHCGGVIVARRWILTAAHCVRSQLVGNLLVRTGGHTLQHGSQTPLTQNSITGHLERDYLVDQIAMHDDFNRLDNLQPPNSSNSNQSNNGHVNMMKSAANTANNADIALLRLKDEIRLNEFAWPVCFPAREAGNFSGHDAIVIGWGKLSEKSDEFSNELQKVKLTIIDNKVCQNWFRQAGRDMPIDDRIICAGFKQGGKDACHGDSGGPLLSRMSNGQYVVVGVVSTGIGCARPLLPGLYSRVSSYITWIERHITTKI